MRALTRIALAAAATAMATAPAASFAVGSALAENGGTFLPFASVLRRCDFSTLDFYDAVGDARTTAILKSGGGQVSADVEVAIGKPNAYYQVRLIQMPRESYSGCHAGAVGTAVGDLHTNGAGFGTVSVSVPLMDGATGAWVAVERPQPGSQWPVEFYSSDYIASI